MIKKKMSMKREGMKRLCGNDNATTTTNNNNRSSVIVVVVVVVYVEVISDGESLKIFIK